MLCHGYYYLQANAFNLCSPSAVAVSFSTQAALMLTHSPNIQAYRQKSPLPKKVALYQGIRFTIFSMIIWFRCYEVFNRLNYLPFRFQLLDTEKAGGWNSFLLLILYAKTQLLLMIMCSQLTHLSCKPNTTRIFC